MRLGEFDPPDMNPYSQLDVSLIQSPAHQSLSLEAAVKSVVLLKNKDGFLPLNDKYKRLAMVGPMINNASTVYGDPTKSPTVDPEVTVTPLKALGHWQESEGHDRTDLELPGKQLQLLKDAVTFSQGVPVVLVLFKRGPLYPFGYGLSYTTFSYSDLKTPHSLSPNHDLTLSVTVTNTGNYTADESYASV
nr:hypothetical protein BaRGS_012829 [Batillaria attramentaria]